MNTQDVLTIQVGIPKYLNVFGDPLRFRILQALCTKSLTVQELATALSSSQSAVSHALAVLRIYDLVCCEQSGRWRTYSMQKDVIARIFLIAEQTLCVSESQME